MNHEKIIDSTLWESYKKYKDYYSDLPYSDMANYDYNESLHVQKRRQEDALRKMHNVRVKCTDGITTLTWKYHQPWGTFEMSQTIAKVMTMNEISNLCDKIQTEWHEDIIDGAKLEDLMIRDLL